MQEQHPRLGRLNWHPFLNGSGEEIPGFAVMRLSASTTAGVPTAIKPTGDAKPLFVFNSATPVAVASYGAFSATLPNYALYETADGTPVNGDVWGPGTNTWKLRKRAPGYTVVGGVTNGRVFVMSPPSGRFLAELTAKTYVPGQFVAYSWRAVVDDQASAPLTYTVQPQSGSYGNYPAYNLENIDLPVPLIVELQRGSGDWYLIMANEEPRIEIIRRTGVFDQYGEVAYIRILLQPVNLWIDTEEIRAIEAQ